MSDEIDALINEFYDANHTIISRDDPIMLVYTLNKTLLREFSLCLNSEHQKLRQELENILFRFGAEKQGHTEYMLNAVISHYKNYMEDILVDFEKEFMVNLKQQTEKVIIEIFTYEEDVRKKMCFNLLASILTFLSTCTLLVAVIFFI